MPDDWVGRDPDFSSPYYPFRRVTAGNGMVGAEQLPYIIGRYLMDLPDGNGYVPPSDNKYPRARLKRLIYWDCPLPLEQPLPTPEQIKSLQFDPLDPAKPPDVERGYRIFMQEFAQQAQYQAQTRLHVYHGHGTALQTGKGLYIRQQIIVKVTCNYSLESNVSMTGISRSYDIVQCVCEAMDGISFGGQGGAQIMNINKIDDERVNTGFKVYFSLDWLASAPNPVYSGG